MIMIIYNFLVSCYEPNREHTKTCNFLCNAVMLPICAVATAVKVLWMCCGTVCLCDSNPYSQSLYLIM